MPGEIKIIIPPIPSRFVLIDFDNIKDRQDGNSGIVDLPAMAMHTINKLERGTDFLSGIKLNEHVKIRLYGGWFEMNRTTKLAQDVASDIQKHFPICMKSSDGTRFYVDCERADRMLVRPKDTIYCTYREEDFTPKLMLRKVYCCEQGSKVSDYMRGFVAGSKKCPSCQSDWRRPMFAGKVQKMIDAMIFCDLSYLLQDRQNKVAIVSSDADMLPVLFKAEAEERNVYYLRETTTQDVGSYGQFHSRLLGRYCKPLEW